MRRQTGDYPGAAQALEEALSIFRVLGDPYGQAATPAEAVTSDAARPAEALRSAAARLHERTGRTAGNESLMRTGVVALAYLDDPDGLAEAARTVSELTHRDPLAGDACVLWCAAIRRAVLDATPAGPGESLDLLPAARRTRWAQLISDAQTLAPAHFSQNGFVVTVLQAAWSAVVSTPSLTTTLRPDRSPASSWNTRWPPRSASGMTPTRWRRCTGGRECWAPDLVRLAVPSYCPG